MKNVIFLLDILQDKIYDFFNLGTLVFRFAVLRNDSNIFETYYSRHYEKWSEHLKSAIWCYKNAWEYSFFGFLNFKWHKYFWYSIIYSKNGYNGWKYILNNFFHN